jgi:hypothetical protein
MPKMIPIQRVLICYRNATTSTRGVVMLVQSMFHRKFQQPIPTIFSASPARSHFAAREDLSKMGTFSGTIKFDLAPYQINYAYHQ